MTYGHTPLNRWEPASLAEVADRFGDLKTPWWVAGGFAIELAVGRRTRDHGDIDVLLLRRDQLAVQHALPDWKWWAADPPGSLRPWASGEVLPESVHDVWCQPQPGSPWRIQILLDEAQGEEWVSRRDPRVRRPIGALGLMSADGIPYLAPEVQLFYKAKEPRPKDQADLDAALPTLADDQRHWLIHAITQAYGRHPWADRLLL
ncbi:amino acid transporter [Yinghuangia sp. ASG 101]|uniref:nucleotidyltransferase domain-containing protein n=1 Tax=Yinghuangia sp. ASG 101 TaxID=2896848 RepID=UPI001E2DBBA1|nr:amino acid transporter [Yinghuangia sp. ASG 101]UGQ11321.1 amino acid transporter [Yinghuangia sp. ASG 101]